MLALEYSSSVPRYAAARLSRRAGLASLRLVERRPPALPAPDWLPVRPRLSGICGSDHALVDGGASLYLSSLTSTPFVPGHEIVGEVAAGQVSAGLQIGFCRETGGGWSEGLVAHRSQLHPVPDELDDEDAVLIEPLACALHAVRQAGLDSSAAVAVIGAGAIGLMTIAALRELHAEITVVAVAKHRGQELEARRLGADEVCAPGDLHLAGARLTGARRLVGHAGRELLLGGFDAVFDCVGSGAALEAAVTVVRPRGTVVLVGMPGRVTADLALAWQREVEIRGAYGYRDDFGAALELATRLRPGRLVAHGWVLRDYRRALEQSRRATRAGRAKTVFDLRAT